MVELLLAEDKKHEHNVDYVGYELSQPCPESDHDVQLVLLLPALDRVQRENSRPSCLVIVPLDVKERGAIEKHFRQTKHDNSNNIQG